MRDGTLQKNPFMNRTLLAATVLVLGVLLGRGEESTTKSSNGQAAYAAGIAQAPQQRRSPHETISRMLEDNRVTIVYGRPYTKDWNTGVMRKIWGDLVPFDKIWRLGADEATTLITQRSITLGDTLVPAGVYTLFLIPAADGSAKLIVNKEIGQWGIDPYHADRELARIDMKRDSIAPNIDQFTIALDKGTPNGGVLKLIWEHTMYSVPYRVKK